MVLHKVFHVIHTTNKAVLVHIFIHGKEKKKFKELERPFVSKTPSSVGQVGGLTVYCIILYNPGFSYYMILLFLTTLPLNTSNNIHVD